MDVGRSTKQAVKSTFYKGRLQALLRRVHPSRNPVIVRYHSVGGDERLISRDIIVSPQAFEEQIRYFSECFTVISMDVLVDCILSQRPFPKNTLVLTFDDGYADNYRAAELLHRYGLTGVFYITAGCIETQEYFWVAEIRHLLEHTQRQKIYLSAHGYAEEVSLCTQQDRAESVRKLTRLLKTVDVNGREEIRKELRRQLDDVPPFPDSLMLTWQQLKEMVTMGMEIGGHTMTHCNLPNAQEHEAWFEIVQCKALLERQLGVQVRHFAYPNGGSVQHYNNQVKALLDRAGFRSACTSKSGFVGPKCDRLELSRVRAIENVAEMVWEVETARWLGPASQC